ncbi:serine/threonine-protein phosphatase 2A 65 kDa regulatory subunit A beta isoform-like isoform X2 [Nicotiana sylvestris]|uniref:serine/threonine-protein phosphatase 2A 65 kDa regulatory subunit A beta isoform-like isoform X2 n=1 Tax=Nicotiana sylvestris TaxID=4096 RepID=UPI00388C3C46
MAQQLGVFIPYVGGVEYATVLLPPLEGLCRVGETCVRDKAVESLCKIGSQMREPDLIESFIPLLKKLADKEWTAQSSSCGLFHIAYPNATEPLREELRTLYNQLCHNETPLVRKAAAKNLGKFAETVEQPYLMNYIMPMFKHLTQDGQTSIKSILMQVWECKFSFRKRSDLQDQDSVRLLAVKNCAVLGKLLVQQVCLAEILPVIISLSQDDSWQVRYTVADQLCELCETVGPDATRTEMVPAYVRLLRDNETDVRRAAAGKVTKFFQILSPELPVQHILPCVKDQTVEQLLPIFLTLLKDESTQIRVNIISKIDQVNQVIGIDLLSQSLLSVIDELSEAKHWRVRVALINFIPLLASQLGVSFYNDKIGALCMQWLTDEVHQVRVAAANNLVLLAVKFGPEWALEHIISQVLDMVNDRRYQYRINILRTLSLLAPVVGLEITTSTIFPVILAASTDRVPNVRFNVAKVLPSLASIVDQSVVEERIRPCLNKLNQDEDVDVRFFANKALQAIYQ